MFEPLYHIVGPPGDPGVIIGAESPAEAHEQFLAWVERVAADPPTANQFRPIGISPDEEFPHLDKAIRRRESRERAADRHERRSAG